MACVNCKYFKIINEGKYSTFECRLRPFQGAYSQTLPDIGWYNYQSEISKYCPKEKEIYG